MTKTERENASSKLLRLLPKLRNKAFRHAYFEKSLKAYLANQIRALRADETQKEFGQRIDMPQNVVSRLEDENYGKLNTQTLIDIANRLELGLVIKFVDYPTFLRLTADMSEQALRPRSFDADILGELADVRPKARKVGAYTKIQEEKMPTAPQTDRMGVDDGAIVITI